MYASYMDNPCMNKNLEPEYRHDGSFEQRFFALFTRIARLLRQHCEPTTTGHTLSAAQLRYLYLLEHAGAPQPISYFADGVFSNRSNATQMIDRLQGEGLVIADQESPRSPQCAGGANRIGITAIARRKRVACWLA